MTTCQLDPKEQTSLEFELQKKNIVEYSFEISSANVKPFVKASIC